MHPESIAGTSLRVHIQKVWLASRVAHGVDTSSPGDVASEDVGAGGVVCVSIAASMMRAPSSIMPRC